MRISADGVDTVHLEAARPPGSVKPGLDRPYRAGLDRPAKTSTIFWDRHCKVMSFQLVAMQYTLAVVTDVVATSP